MARFSRRGERATEFERALVAVADADTCRGTSALFLELARRIGVDALLVVFDEVGGEKLHIPTREWFVGELWRKQRDAEILRRLAGGEAAQSVADDFGVHERTVQRVAQRHGVDDAPPDAVIEARA